MSVRTLVAPKFSIAGILYPAGTNTQPKGRQTATYATDKRGQECSQYSTGGTGEREREKGQVGEMAKTKRERMRDNQNESIREEEKGEKIG